MKLRIHCFLPLCLLLACDKVERDWSKCSGNAAAPCAPGYTCSPDFRCVPYDAGVGATDSPAADVADAPSEAGREVARAEAPTFTVDAAADVQVEAATDVQEDAETDVPVDASADIPLNAPPSMLWPTLRRHPNRPATGRRRGNLRQRHRLSRQPAYVPRFPVRQVHRQHRVRRPYR